MSEKIKPQHLTRKAILYVRQSSAYQVMNNLESQKGAALLDFSESLRIRGSLTGASPYDSAFFLTIFRVPRRLGWDKKTADGTVSGARRLA